MTHKVWITFIIALAAITVVTLLAEESEAATTYVVDGGGNGDATTVAGGLALVSDGDTLRIWDGTYNEYNLYINDTISMIGNGTANTKIDGIGATQPLLRINNVYVNVSHIYFDGRAYNGHDCIYILDYANDTYVHNNTIYGGRIRNLRVNDADRVVVENCTFSSGQYGLDSSSVGNNGLVKDNSFSHFTFRAASFLHSQNWVIMDNVFRDNDVGLVLTGGPTTIAYRNRFYSNRLSGMDGSGSIAYCWNSSSEGNFWDDWHVKDADQDGFGDQAYPIYPLVGAADEYDYFPRGTYANISSPLDNVRTPSAPYTLGVWANESCMADYYNWTWGDGSYTNTTSISCSHLYTVDDLYTLTLTIWNTTYSAKHVSSIAVGIGQQTLTVGVGGEYSYISDAINVSAPDDVIHIYGGWHNVSTSIWANHTLNFVGNGTHDTIVAFNSTGTNVKQFFVQADFVNISEIGFTGGYLGLPTGMIVVDSVSHAHFWDCRFFEGNQSWVWGLSDQYALYFDGADNCTIDNSSFWDCRLAAFLLAGSDDFLFENCVYSEGREFVGISAFVSPVENLVVRGNVVVNDGSHVVFFVDYVSGGNIENNVFSGGSGFPALWINSGTNNLTIHNNTISDASIGIYLQDPTVKDCLIYNNILRGNVLNAQDDGGTGNHWNLSATGNIWDDWTAPDTNGDGIVDDPRPIAGTAGSQDNYPLSLYAKISSPLNLANYLSSPLTVYFWSNGTIRAEYYHYTWGDGSYTNSTSPTGSHTYSPTIGRAHYFVTLTIWNDTFKTTAVDVIEITFGPLSVVNTYTMEYFSLIQVAIDDAETLDGHDLMIYAGVYEERLTVDKAVILYGASSDTVIIRPVYGNSITISSDNVCLRNLGIEAATSTGIFSDGYDGIQILGCRINNSGANGAYIKNGVWANITNCVFYANTLDGLAFENYDNIFISGVDIYDNLDDGLYFLTTCENVAIIDCHVYGNGDQGLEVKNACNMFSIDGGNYSDNGGRGIFSLTNSIRFNITGVEANNNLEHGIYLTDGLYVNITGVETLGNGFDGLILTTFSYGTILGCTSNGNGVHGAYIKNGFYANISGFTSTGNGHDGLTLNNYDYANVNSSTICSNTMNGLYMVGCEHNIAYRNTITSNGGNGIRLAGCVDGLLWNNNIYSNTGVNTYDSGAFLTNSWNRALPWGGNYYGDYGGGDVDGDRVGETSYTISGGSAVDGYPFVEADGWDEVHIVGDEYATIAAAIGVCAVGDYVWILPGTYVENPSLSTAGVTIRGDSPGTVMIDGGGGACLQVSSANTRFYNLNFTGGTYGIAFANAGNFNVSACVFYDNGYGLYVVSSDSSLVTENDFRANTGYGIYMTNSASNEIYHNNFYDNGVHAYDDLLSNAWSLALPVGGNFWDDWTGPDADHDGFVDEPRILDGLFLLNRDSLPLAAAGLWANILYVNQSGSKDYTTIQGAIDNALDGYYIFVDAGTYAEQLTIDKELTIVGETLLLVIIAAPTGNAVTISADNVTFDNMTIEGAVSSGLYCDGYDNIRITYVRVDGCGAAGAYFKNGENITIDSARISNNTQDGMVLEQYDNSQIYRSKFDYNGDDGLNILSSSHGEVQNNTFNNNTDHGVELLTTTNNYHIYHNNFINNDPTNGEQAWDDGVGNQWNKTYPDDWENLTLYELGLYGGNYWSNYTDYDNYSGPNQDTNGTDGFWDTPYDIPGGAGAKDHYPHTTQSGWDESQTEFLTRIMGLVIIIAIILLSIGLIGRVRGGGGF